MWLIIATMLTYAALESIMVGLSFGAITRRFGSNLSMWRVFALLMPVFAFLAAYYVPAIDALDATLTIRNQEIAREIGPGSPIEVSELMRFGVSDVAVWAAQALGATVLARWSRGQG